MKNILKKLKIGDIFVIFIILLGAIGTFFLTRPQGETKNATILVNGVVVQQVTLPCTDTIRLENGVVVQFDGMRACILSSDCPDHTCVKKGWLTIQGQTSVCLPNRTVLQMDGGDIIIGG